ncbi:MAG TPA: hypothetical protein PK375_07750 [Rhodocyclaceae bacterium]|nr:hypothetical protein [Rhodocyclaceae bacterium]HNH35793.1 hypothetical protein [Rhodocyclaceae bacterium]
MYLTLQDCIDMSELSEDEVLAIAEHEGLPELVALEMGNYLIQEPGGSLRIKRMIEDDIRQARAKGDRRHSAALKRVLKHYVDEHVAVAE